MDTFAVHHEVILQSISCHKDQVPAQKGAAMKLGYPMCPPAQNWIQLGLYSNCAGFATISTPHCGLDTLVVASILALKSFEFGDMCLFAVSFCTCHLLFHDRPYEALVLEKWIQAQLSYNRQDKRQEDATKGKRGSAVLLSPSPPLPRAVSS